MTPGGAHTRTPFTARSALQGNHAPTRTSIAYDANCRAPIENQWGRVIDITGPSEPLGVNVASAAKAAVHA